MEIIRQSAARTILVGPVLNVDGTPYTTDDLARTDFKITKAGSVGDLNASATVAHSHQGHFAIGLTTSDTGTLGGLVVSLNKATLAMPTWRGNVLPAVPFDSLVAGSDYLDVSLVQWLGTEPAPLSSQQVQAVVPATQKVDVETIKTKAVTVDAGGTTFPASIHASGASVAKSPATLDWAADVSNKPTIGTSTLTAQQVWEYATRTLSAFGFEVALSSAALAALVAAIEAEIADDATGEAVKQAIVAKLLENLPDLDDLTLAAIAGAVQAALEAAHGAGSWETADTSALALESSITALAAAVGTPLQASAYTAPANATVTAIHDLVKAAGAGDVAAILAAAARVAALVEDSGGDRFTAKALEAAPGGVGSDPLLAEVPGSYAAGSAGAALGLVPGIKAKTDLLGVAGVTVVSPTASGGQLLTIVRGDDYLAADGRAPAWSSDDWPDLTAAAVQLTARDKTSGDVALSAAGEVTVAGAGDQTVRVELPTAATSVLRVGAQRYVFDVEATLTGGSVVTLVMGTVNVLEDQTR